MPDALTVEEMRIRLEHASGLPLTRQIEQRLQRPTREELREARAGFREHFVSRTGRFLRAISARQRPDSRMPAIKLRVRAAQANILEFGGRTHKGGVKRRGGFMLTNAAKSAGEEVPDLTLDAVSKVVLDG